MELKILITEYLKNKRVMQLATCVDNQPWVCSVHYCIDENLNFYWLSKDYRRHSEEIAQNNKAAITVKIQEDTPQADYVIGISAEGKASLLHRKEVKKAIKLFNSKFGLKPSTQKALIQGSSPEIFYKLKPSAIVLFDNKTFPDNPRQEVEYNVLRYGIFTRTLNPSLFIIQLISTYFLIKV